MCIELHLDAKPGIRSLALTLVLSVHSGNSRHWRPSCNLHTTCRKGRGVPLDDFVREHSGDRDPGPQEKAKPASAAHTPVPDFLRSYDHADRGAGRDHTSARKSD